MAKMFPNIFPDDSSSSGERKVFEYLKNNAPAEWVVLHSFRIPEHKKVIFGEADFVVITPNCGIIILEIKSGGVGFDGTNWIFVNRSHEKTYKQRGPFQQARDAMFEIERIITKRLGNAYSRTEIPYGYGVIFTDESEFPVDSIVEDEPWRLCQKSDNNNYCSFVKKLYSKQANELQQLGKRIPSGLSMQMVDAISKTLRPIVDCVAPLKSFVSASENDIISLTEEQYSCLDDIEINDQMVITGGAGTGKTLIAVEEAKRFSKKEKVAFFCFNKNLAEYIKNSVGDNTVDVYSLHSFLTKICGGKLTGVYLTGDYFSKTLPEMACKCAIDLGIDYDRIIVDEFQDLCTEGYLNFFDVILKNGLLEGKYTFYGDFSRQAIYGEESSLSTLRKKSFFARKHLYINCRNTLHIGNELINITGYEDKKYKLKINGEPVDYYVWDTVEDENRQLFERIKELKKKGFSSSSIVILSPKKRINSIVGMYDPDKYLIGDYGDGHYDASLAMFSTIYAFKGLESEIVILADVDDYFDSQLMYVALSRARSKLIVLESATASKQRKKMTIKR